jgi:hypothetical protein
MCRIVCEASPAEKPGEGIVGVPYAGFYPLEITADVITELGVRKIAAATAGRIMSAGTVRAAGQQAGLPAERVSAIALLATNALEAEIEIFFERLKGEMERLTGETEKAKPPVQ